MAVGACPGVKGCAAAVAVAVTAGLLAACSSSPAHDRLVTLGPNLTVTLPPGAPHVTATRVTATVKSRLAERLAPPEHLTASGRLPGRAVLAFHVGHVRGRPFLAWLDHGQWMPVPSTYDARAGTVSAVVPHFSTWAPFAWATDQVKAWLASALRTVFGLGTATDPACGTSTVPVTDSNPGHHTIGACALEAMALPDGVITKIANLRGYPIDLFYPASLGDQCGEYGNCLHIDAEDDIWLKLGAALSVGGHRVLMPGSSTATAITVIPPGHTAVFRTAVDSPAMFMAFLEAGIGVFSTIVSSKVKAVKAAAAALDALTASQCTSQGWQPDTGLLTLTSAVSLARAAFSCVSSVLPDILDKLGLEGASFVVGAFQVAASFVSAVFSSLWGEIDTSVGAHVLTVAGTSAESVTVPADAQGGVDTGISALSGDRIVITGSGAAGYGYEGAQPCAGYPTTHPDGSRYLGSFNCGPKDDPNATLPGAAIGLLIARIGSGAWFAVGTGTSVTAGGSGDIYLAYNDTAYSDNTGSYSATVTITSSGSRS